MSKGHRARTVVLGGGLSGLAAAWEIARGSDADVIVLERSSVAGGLAGSFEHGGRAYPLGYHHILPTDRTLLSFLDLIGALPDVRWIKVRMPFLIDGRLYELSRPADFLRLPIRMDHKARFVAMMLRAYQKSDWSDWQGRSVDVLVDRWCGRSVRTTIFEPLCRLKFELPADQVSAAWMGTRLHAREGSGKLGFIPGTNWTKVLCEGMVKLAQSAGVEIRTGARVSGLRPNGHRIRSVVLDTGEEIAVDTVMSAIPTDVLTDLLGEQRPSDGISYTALLSLVGGTRQELPREFYWMSLLSPSLTASGLFVLSNLNSTIGPPGEHCLNFISHLHDRRRPLFNLAEDDLLERYHRDFKAVFGVELNLDWYHLSRIPQYSPVFVPNYQNPPVHSYAWDNLYLTGNYQTYPSVASTGTALRSGLESARVLLSDPSGDTTAARPLISAGSGRS